MNVDQIIGRCTAAETEELARAVLPALPGEAALRIVVEWPATTGSTRSWPRSWRSAIMAVEAARGCGFRKVGGLYMVSGELSQPCGRLPLELHVCPACGGGIKQARSWTWVQPRKLLADAPACAFNGGRVNALCNCPISPANLPERAGLLWIGAQYYPTARDFMEEASRLGVSRRIPAVPREFVVGETWVLMAHPAAITRPVRNLEERNEALDVLLKEQGVPCEDDEDLAAITAQGPLTVTRPGIVTMFRPTAVEQIFVESDRDTDRVQEAIDKGRTPVFVPDDDPDHNPKAPKRQRPLITDPDPRTWANGATGDT